MKTGEAEKYIGRSLARVYEEAEAAAIAGQVLEAITGKTRSQRLLQQEEPLPADAAALIETYLKRLLRQEPVQYVLGRSWFYGLPLYVDSDVLIPRPETEELVEWIINDVKASGKNVFDPNPLQADETTKLKIIDIGTGSGCIALALKKHIPKAEVWGCDTSDRALNVARRNGAALDIRVDFQGLDFLDRAQQKQLPTVDIIVSNPPYIPLKDKHSMQANVLNYEPHLALFVPDEDPLLFYRTLANFGSHRLYEGGTIYVEVHENLGQDVIALFKSGGYENIEIRKDMQGKERMIKVAT
ncbi:MAG TPA: peptide chain release factor N(5)-glutamine methyltransferase [Flavisolibacter sp.]|nr:peptide chain release factor N(5)-glutamine methyltransferase [Flavisolibacter sp.]